MDTGCSTIARQIRPAASSGVSPGSIPYTLVASIIGVRTSGM